MNPTTVELKVPAVGESVTEVEIAEWLKKEGDPVRQDENLVVLETDKATVEVPSPITGRLTKILKPKGQRVQVDEILGQIERKAEGRGQKAEISQKAETDRPPLPAAPAPPASPAASAAPTANAQKQAAAPQPDIPHSALRTPHSEDSAFRTPHSEAEIVPMSLLRRKIAERLVQARNTAALLTTFNEVDMTAVVGLRKEHQERFQERYGCKLGFMSFFVKAAIEALKETPQLNAEIRGTDIVFHHTFDIGIAIGAGKGLVVPVLRQAERLSFAEIEKAIAAFAQKAKTNKIQPEDLEGGTFTITNGGVYGSLLSTPIINPPQSGVLGLHAIQDRPVAVAGQVVIRPMMYVALTYDHRLVDGREAVTFLRRVKDLMESPARMLFEV